MSAAYQRYSDLDYVGTPTMLSLWILPWILPLEPWGAYKTQVQGWSGSW